MTSPSPAAWFRRALPTRRRAIAAAVVVVLVAAAVTWAVWPQGPGVRTESAMLTVRSGPSGDQPVDLDTTSTCRTTPRPAGRSRRCCWHTGSAARRSRCGPTPRSSPGAAMPFSRGPRGFRPQRRRDPFGQPGLRGARRSAAAGLAGRAAGGAHRRRR
ncbi:hypothetical protein NKG94_38955 [Micromonospora sp. M12]